MQVFRIESEIAGGMNILHSVFRGVSTETVICDDGVTYSTYETKILIQSGRQMPKAVHLLKRAFGGALLSIEKKETGDYGEVGTARI